MNRFLRVFLCCFSLPLAAQNRQVSADGDAIFNSASIHDVYLQFSQSGYWDTLVVNHDSDVYTRCNVTFDGITINDVGVKLKGNSSYNNNSMKKSMKIDFNEYVAGQDIDGLKKLNLNNGFKDPTFMREKLMLDFLQEHNLPGPRCTYARVYLNNTYWGLYTLVEDINDKFCTQRFGNNDGNRFKGDPSGDLKWYGSNASSYYNRYELDNNDSLNDWTGLVHLIDIINNTPSAQLYDSLETVLQTWDFVYQWAADILFVNLDSYPGSGHNYFIYHNQSSGLWQWIQWDVNEAFGNFNMGMQVSQLQTLPWNYTGQMNNRPLITNMLQNSTYQSRYISALCDLTRDFTNALLDPKIDSLANVIRTDVYADNLKFYSNQQFEDNQTMDMNMPTIPGLKPFITARHNSLTAQLQTFGCFTGQPETAAAAQPVIAPNPFGTITTITFPETTGAANVTAELFDVTGKNVSDRISVSVSGHSMQLHFGTLDAGIYTLKLIRTGSENIFARLVITGR